MFAECKSRCFCSNTTSDTGTSRTFAQVSQCDTASQPKYLAANPDPNQYLRRQSQYRDWAYQVTVDQYNDYNVPQNQHRVSIHNLADSVPILSIGEIQDVWNSDRNPPLPPLIGLINQYPTLA